MLIEANSNCNNSKAGKTQCPTYQQTSYHLQHSRVPVYHEKSTPSTHDAGDKSFLENYDSRLKIFREKMTLMFTEQKPKTKE